jgi:hypothetical protein
VTTGPSEGEQPGGLEPVSDAEIALYTADRADGSAILGVTMNLMAVIATYGGLVVAALATDFFTADTRGPWLQAVIGAPLWGLLCYQYLLLCLVHIRTNSIQLLEKKLLGATKLTVHERSQVGSDAGNWITNINTQPSLLKAGSLAAYVSLTLAVVVVNIVSILLVYSRNHAAFWTGLSIHMVLAGCLVSIGFAYLFRADTMLGDLKTRNDPPPA